MNLPSEANLPADWWQYRSSAEILSELFKRHLLGLLLSFKLQDQTHHEFFTGFLLELNDVLLWVTAGHVVDRVHEILNSQSVTVLHARWADGFGTSGAESLPIDPRELQSKAFSINTQYLDFGTVIIAGLNELNIRKNNDLRIMTTQAWRNLQLAKPEGYYVVGFPDPWFEIKETPLSIHRNLKVLTANLACLPVQRISPESSDDEFWSDPDAFYGRILPYIESEGDQPQTIVGMSGGPLLAVEHDRNGQLRYYLFGIQRSWLKNRRIIRAEPVEKLIALLND